MQFQVNADFTVPVEADSADEAINKVRVLITGATSFANNQSFRAYQADSPYPGNPMTTGCSGQLNAPINRVLR